VKGNLRPGRRRSWKERFPADLEPKSLRAIEDLAKLESQLGNHKAAARAFTTWLELNTDSKRRPGALIFRGIEFLKLGRTASALRDFEDVLGAEPSATALNNLCWYLTVANIALDRAMEYCNEALKLEPRSPSYLDSKATLLLRLRKYDESIATYDEAIRLRPDFANSLYGRGLASQFRCRCRDPGMSDLRRAVDTLPTYSATSSEWDSNRHIHQPISLNAFGRSASYRGWTQVTDSQAAKGCLAGLEYDLRGFGRKSP
jgi:tetratricopeptide (TPR) repeat protein